VRHTSIRSRPGSFNTTGAAAGELLRRNVVTVFGTEGGRAVRRLTAGSVKRPTRDVRTMVATPEPYVHYRMIVDWLGRSSGR
jgi:hypothetical protein